MARGTYPLKQDDCCYSPLKINATAAEALADNRTLAALSRFTISGNCWYASYDLIPTVRLSNFVKR